MASHTKTELREAARGPIGQVARARRPRCGPPRRSVASRPPAAGRRAGVFDGEALARRSRQRGALRGCFVTGTDTGVGKTVVAAAIAAALARAASAWRPSSRSSRGSTRCPIPTGRPTTSCWPP